jgi:hypothetical protein
MARGCPQRKGVSSVPCRGRSLGRSAPSEPMKLPSEACIRREALQLLSCLRRPALSPHLAMFCGKCAHGIMETLAHAPGRTVAPCAAKSSPDGCSANALDNQPAEPAGTAPEPPLVVAKCSVMMGGNWCRADGCSGAQDRNLAALGAAVAPPAHANFGCAADHGTCAPR